MVGESVKILVLNSGSSSLKFQLIETTAELAVANRDRRLAQGEVARIGAEGSVRDHDEALQAAFQNLAQSGVSRLEDIEGVGHRIVHGAEHFQHSIIIDEAVARLIESCNQLAPLHNPHNLKGYYASKRLLPHATHVAVFDTAFHHTLPPKAYLYGIPYGYYERHKIRRYGFHGTSHRYLSGRFAQIRSTPPEALKLITCHLGNGCSVCAIEGGQSVDTSMGFTPLEGLLMGTRPGDLDPGVVTWLMQAENKDVRAMEDLLNKESGLAGLSGVSNDMQDLLKAAAAGQPRAQAAMEVFCYRVTKYIGAYTAAMNGVDAVIFSGGIGEHAAAIRERICAPMSALGIRLDRARNEAAAGREQEISEVGGHPEVWVIPTDEELLIARDTLAAIAEGGWSGL